MTEQTASTEMACYPVPHDLGPGFFVQECGYGDLSFRVTHRKTGKWAQAGSVDEALRKVAGSTTAAVVENVVKNGNMFNIVRAEDGRILRRFRVVEIDLDQSKTTEQIKSKVRTEVKTEQGKKTGVEVVEEATCCRRKQDDRLFDALERHRKPLIRAFEMIGFGFTLANADVQFAIAKYGDKLTEVAGEAPSPEWFMDVERDYLRWADEVMHDHGGNDAYLRAIDIIVFGLSCRQTDAKWRKADTKLHTSNGSSMKHLINMLGVYCDMMHRNRQAGWDG
tara:strand:- start:26239 stop:27075 length:837 start_codon:yes stop_codon:yes gene_type:complete